MFAKRVFDFSNLAAYDATELFDEQLESRWLAVVSVCTTNCELMSLLVSCAWPLSAALCSLDSNCFCRLFLWRPPGPID